MTNWIVGFPNEGHKELEDTLTFLYRVKDQGLIAISQGTGFSGSIYLLERCYWSFSMNMRLHSKFLVLMYHYSTSLRVSLWRTCSESRWTPCKSCPEI